MVVESGARAIKLKKTVVVAAAENVYFRMKSVSHFLWIDAFCKESESTCEFYV